MPHAGKSLIRTAGSVFYNLDDSTASFYSRGVLLFFAILLNAFASALEVCFTQLTVSLYTC